MVTRSVPAKHVKYQKSTYTLSDIPGTFELASINTTLAYGPTNDVTIGTNDRDWKVKIARGSDASGYYFRNGRYCKFKNATATTQSQSWLSPFRVTNGINNFRGLLQWPDLSVVSDPVLLDQALAKIKRQIRQYDGDFNLMVPMAELGDLRSTIRGTADLATNLMKDLINIKKTRGASAAKYASKAWLNFNFGVKPMLSDAREIAESIAKYLNRQQGIKPLHGSASRSWVTSGKAVGFTGTYHARMRTDFAQVNNLSYKFTGAYNLVVNASNNFGIAAHLHLDPSGLLPAAWELIPYSWVVDYFTTMGAFLDDIFTSPGGSSKFLTCSRRYTCDYTETISHYLSPGAFPNERYVRFDDNTPGVGYVSLYEFERTVYSSIPSLSLRLKTIDEVGKHAVNKLLNLSSLLVQSRIR